MCKAGFSNEVTEVASTDLRKSTACLYQGKCSRFLHWCHGRNIAPCKATIQQLAEFFLYLYRELKLTVSTIKGYRSAFNDVCLHSAWLRFFLEQAHKRMFCSFEKSCPLREITLPKWNLSLVLKSLTHPPYESMKLSSDKLMTWKTGFLLALASAKRVSELLGLSYQVRHAKG